MAKKTKDSGSGSKITFGKKGASKAKKANGPKDKKEKPYKGQGK